MIILAAIDRLVKFIKLANEVEEIFNSEATWIAKHELLFPHANADFFFEQTGYVVRWNDPEGTHEEDVTAYVLKLQDMRDEEAETLDAISETVKIDEIMP